jgi:phosphoglycerate dehydrogenase-like enzyme
MLLAAQRHVVELDRKSRGTDWDVRRLMRDLGLRTYRSQTLGIVGAGRIGKKVALKARGLGFRTIANDPYIESSGDPELPLYDLHEMLGMVDAVAVCCSLNETSEKLLNADAFAAMKPGMILSNCARGRIIDEQALADAMRAGIVASAGLDVRAQEPPDPDNDPLRDVPNVIMTPHIAWVSAEGFVNYHRECASVALEMLATTDRVAVGAG